MSILHQVAPIKGYLKFMRPFKNSYLKKAFGSYMFLANLNPRAFLYEDNNPGIEVGLKLY